MWSSTARGTFAGSRSATDVRKAASAHNQSFAGWHAPAYEGPALTMVTEIDHGRVVDAAGPRRRRPGTSAGAGHLGGKLLSRPPNRYRLIHAA